MTRPRSTGRSTRRSSRSASRGLLVRRYAGLFNRTDGVQFWVELWDFREGSGFSSAPNAPVLSYVMLW